MNRFNKFFFNKKIFLISFLLLIIGCVSFIFYNIKKEAFENSIKSKSDQIKDKFEDIKKTINDIINIDDEEEVLNVVEDITTKINDIIGIIE